MPDHNPTVGKALATMASGFSEELNSVFQYKSLSHSVKLGNQRWYLMLCNCVRQDGSKEQWYYWLRRDWGSYAGSFTAGEIPEHIKSLYPNYREVKP